MSEELEPTPSSPRPKPKPKPVAGGSEPSENTGVSTATAEESPAEETAEPTGMSLWLDAALPWMASFMLHLSIAIVVFFLFFILNQNRKSDEQDKEPIIIPAAFLDPGNPGGPTNPGQGANPNRDSAQDLVKNVVKTDGWASKQNDNDVSKFLEGKKGDSSVALIAAGSGGSTGGGAGNGVGGGGGSLSPFGTPGGGSGSGPRSSFYGTGGNAFRIAFVIDHSGSMVEKMDFVKEEVKKSVTGLSPLQFFSVVTFDEHAKVLGPPSLLRATTSNKEMVCAKISEVRAEGGNDDVWEPFAEAFQTAFAMKPQLVFFLTDGAFDPKFLEVINKLNSDHKVHINTIAYNTGAGGEDSKYAQQLKDLARDNGGRYKFISE